jgi:antirestriction protein ArdC
MGSSLGADRGRSGISPNGRVSVQAHELAHALVRPERDDADTPLDYASEELLAETVAHIVCASLSLDTSASTIPHLPAGR